MLYFPRKKRWIEKMQICSFAPLKRLPPSSKSDKPTSSRREGETLKRAIVQFVENHFVKNIINYFIKSHKVDRNRLESQKVVVRTTYGVFSNWIRLKNAIGKLFKLYEEVIILKSKGNFTFDFCHSDQPLYFWSTLWLSMKWSLEWRFLTNWSN